MLERLKEEGSLFEITPEAAIKMAIGLVVEQQGYLRKYDAEFSRAKDFIRAYIPDFEDGSNVIDVLINRIRELDPKARLH